MDERNRREASAVSGGSAESQLGALALWHSAGSDSLIQQRAPDWHDEAEVASVEPISIDDFRKALEGLTEQDYENFALMEGYQIAKSSRKNYLYQWGKWEQWAAGRKVSALPANPLLVKAYLYERLLKHGHKPPTLRAAAAAISYVHRDNTKPDPCAHPEVRNTLSAAARMKKWQQKQAEALTEKVFWQIIQVACMPRRSKGGSLERPETALHRGRVDIATIGLMRDCLLRVGEAANTVWSHIEPDPAGSGTLWIPESKTDQEGVGEVGYISLPTMTFLDAMRNGASDDDSVIGLRPNQISMRIKRAAIEAGLSDRFSGHSPRVGMTRDLSRSGTSLTRLMNAGRWKSSSMPARYIRRELAKRNAVAEYYNPREDGTGAA